MWQGRCKYLFHTSWNITNELSAFEPRGYHSHRIAVQTSFVYVSRVQQSISNHIVLCSLVFISRSKISITNNEYRTCTPSDLGQIRPYFLFQFKKNHIISLLLFCSWNKEAILCCWEQYWFYWTRIQLKTLNQTDTRLTPRPNRFGSCALVHQNSVLYSTI
jgi:hypothetical protein